MNVGNKNEKDLKSRAYFHALDIINFIDSLNNKILLSVQPRDN